MKNVSLGFFSLHKLSVLKAGDDSSEIFNM